MTELLDLVRDMFMLAVTALIPLALAGIFGGVLGGMFVAYIGVQDQSIASLVRAASVVVALVVTGATIAGQVDAFASRAWGGLAALGTSDDGGLARAPARGG